MSEANQSRGAVRPFLAGLVFVVLVGIVVDIFENKNQEILALEIEAATLQGKVATLEMVEPEIHDDQSVDEAFTELKKWHDAVAPYYRHVGAKHADLSRDARMVNPTTIMSREAMREYVATAYLYLAKPEQLSAVISEACSDGMTSR